MGNTVASFMEPEDPCTEILNTYVKYVLQFKSFNYELLDKTLLT